MGIRKYGLCFFIFSCFMYLSASLSPSSSAHVQENRMGSTKENKDSSSMREGSNKVVEVNRRGGHGGHARGIGGRTYGGGYGGSSHPDIPGATTVMPVYGARAVHRPGKSSANSYRGRVGVTSVCAAILAILVT